MKEWDQFPDGPIITPTTKAVLGHDENISPEEIVEQGLATQEQYNLMAKFAKILFDMGSRFASEMGLILVDTKYEFGLYKNNVFLNDEIHTPDSSRYLYKEGFQESVIAGKTPKSLDKEFVRQWLLNQGFSGHEGQTMPEMTDEFVQQISDRYLELYRNIMGEELQQVEYDLDGIASAINAFIDGVKEFENIDNNN
jgi:phosphoribosylaminoimidazole-succinocarboxamide synthase